MAKPIFTSSAVKSVLGGACLLSFDIPTAYASPEEFAAAVQALDSEITEGDGVIINGRGPTWGHAMIAHKFHPTAWIGMRDPRLGVVIVQSHCRHAREGQVIPFPEV